MLKRPTMSRSLPLYSDQPPQFIFCQLWINQMRGSITCSHPSGPNWGSSSPMTLRMRTLIFEVCSSFPAVHNSWHLCTQPPLHLRHDAVLEHQLLQQLHCILGAVQHGLCYHFSQHLLLHVHRLQHLILRAYSIFLKVCDIEINLYWHSHLFHISEITTVNIIKIQDSVIQEAK